MAIDMCYEITFHSDWHCGTGLAAGADVDALVIKDDDGLPYIPGKTIKGLVREAVEAIIAFRENAKQAPYDQSDIQTKFKQTFGYFNDAEEIVRGNTFFTNAELPEQEHNAVISGNLQRFMYRKISCTAIDANGIAEEHSLRKMEVVVPCTLEGKILNIDEAFEDILKDAMGYIKRIGQNRNRGLGRCSFSIKKNIKNDGVKI